MKIADGNECVAAWKAAVEDRERPSVLALSRQVRTICVSIH